MSFHLSLIIIVIIIKYIVPKPLEINTKGFGNLKTHKQYSSCPQVNVDAREIWWISKVITCLSASVIKTYLNIYLQDSCQVQVWF